VSNHGGRQLDGTVSPLRVLPGIVKACPSVPVMIDSGFRRGTDVLKALALGAAFVFIGRPFNYAAAVAGEVGVRKGITLLRDEVSRNMAMLGVSVVLNGAVRDADIIAAGSFPIYAAGVTHRGPYKDGPGEINVPIALDGMVIQPGDLVIGDADGLLCVPHDDVEQVLAACREKVALEQKTITNIRAGKHDTSWVDARLKAIGCDPTPR
jgi:hypothetical protein